MSIRKSVAIGGESNIYVSNDYGHTTLHALSDTRWGASAIIVLPNEAVNDLIAALLDVQEDSAASEAANRD